MVSAALLEWKNARERRLSELYAAHLAVGGPTRGRRYATEQLNWSITLRLAGEWQGYLRDLHDEATDAFLARTNHPTPAFESNLRSLLTLQRDVDTKNATPSTMQRDFLRFGFRILDDIKVTYVNGADWLRRVEELNEARNGIAHDDRVKMTTAAGGPTLTLGRVKNWHSAVRQLVKACDRIAAVSVATVTGGSVPW